MGNYRIAVYPYSPEIDPFLRYIFFLNPQYEIRSLISPRGWGYVNEIISLGDPESGKSLKVCASLDEIEDSINCIFIPEFESTVQFESNIIDNIENKLPDITKIICTARLKKANLEKLIKICVNTNGRCDLEIKNQIKTEQDYNLKVWGEIDAYLEDIPVPIIAVAGMLEKVDKFHTSLVLRDMFLNDGYKVSQIGSRNYCEMMGFHSFPGFMLNSAIDEAKKVILFNRYVKQIYDIEKPDIIIISIPGAAQSYNSKFTNRFGILHYLVSKAFAIDFLIMCTFFEPDGIELFELISQSCFYKFGCSVDCFHMSNLLIDYMAMNERQCMEYLSIPLERVTKTISEQYKEFPIPVINIFDKSDATILYKQIIDKLSYNQHDVNLNVINIQ
ncbi:MAG: TIGR04066 family peptide maturation system protein [Oscillospiraceae bacterium]|nr:TIGR04066 family peptide maturation system protein [Oscillospiraceae bacterium]